MQTFYYSSMKKGVWTRCLHWYGYEDDGGKAIPEREINAYRAIDSGVLLRECVRDCCVCNHQHDCNCCKIERLGVPAENRANDF